MSFFEIGPNDSIYYEYETPSENQPLTFVFINAITGDTGLPAEAQGDQARH